MEIQEIEITIAPDGKVELRVRGVPGTQCLDLTRELELALGNEIIERQMTADADAPQTVSEQNYLHTGIG